MGRCGGAGWQEADCPDQTRSGGNPRVPGEPKRVGLTAHARLIANHGGLAARRTRTPSLPAQAVACSPYFPDLFCVAGGQHYGIAVCALWFRCGHGCLVLGKGRRGVGVGVRCADSRSALCGWLNRDTVTHAHRAPAVLPAVPRTHPGHAHTQGCGQLSILGQTPGGIVERTRCSLQPAY